MEIKIQCGCGAKYAFEVGDDGAPVRFVCPACGVDGSAGVNQVIRQKLGLPAPVAVAIMPAAPVASPVESAPVEAPPAAVAQLCLKHPGEGVVDRCRVCGKGICPECMAQFGYVCSAYCKGQAERLRLEIPAFAGQRHAVEAREWKKIRYVALAGAAAIALLIGLYAWYELVGSRPGVEFSAKIADPSEDGFCEFVPPHDLVFRHGADLKRYDLDTKKLVWSAALVDPKAIAKQATEQFASVKARRERWQEAMSRRRGRGAEDEAEGPARGGAGLRSDAQEIEELAEWLERSTLENVRVHHRASQVWVVTPEKLTRIEWVTGRVAQEIPWRGRVTKELPGEDALYLVSEEDRQETLTRVDWTTGELSAAPLVATTNAASPAIAKGVSGRAGAPAPGSRPIPPGRPNFAQAANERIEAAMAEENTAAEAGYYFADATRTEVVHAGRNLAQLDVKLLEKKLTATQAIKPRTGPSELEKGVTAANSVAAMSEVLNEWQEERTGGKRWEDESRYAVTIRRLQGESAPEWKGEVNGPPALYAVRSADLLVAGKAVVAFDKTNRKLWEATLAYSLMPDLHQANDLGLRFDDAERTPCWEDRATVYLADEGMLTAFDLATGNVRWRLPSVGVSHVSFGPDGALYVSTTSASIEQVKYSQQVDLSRKVTSLLLKVNAGNGSIVWRRSRVGDATEWSGKFLYALDRGIRGGGFPMGGGKIRAFVEIARLDPADGRSIWEYSQSRYPLAVTFERNRFALLFPDELQVVRFRSLF